MFEIFEQLAELQSRLADLELQLLTLRLELGEFEKLYYAKVGALYAELDELEAQIAERNAQRHPLDSKAAEVALRPVGTDVGCVPVAENQWEAN